MDLSNDANPPANLGIIGNNEGSMDAAIGASAARNGSPNGLPRPS
jgi:hypothetical protein